MDYQNFQLVVWLETWGFYYIKTFKKYLTREPKWLLMYVLGRFKTVRSIMLFYYKYRHRAREYDERNSVDERHSVFEKPNVNDVLKQVKTDGFYLGINLSETILNEILDFAKHNYYYGDGNFQFGFCSDEKEEMQKKYEKSFRIGRYFNTASLCPAIQKLNNDPKLLKIAAKYLGTEALHTDNRLWWSFPGEAKAHERTRSGQVFHYDLDDYRSLKFFFYLTDVDLSTGPHVCIRNSHKNKKIAYLISLSRVRSDKDIIDYYGAESVVTICGKAGFGFAEDPFCFHRGIPPTSKKRLILEIQFSINSYGVSGDIVDPLVLKN